MVYSFEVNRGKNAYGTTGAVSFEHFLAWLDQIRQSLESHETY